MFLVARQAFERARDIGGFKLARARDGLPHEHFSQDGCGGKARRTALRFKRSRRDLVVFEFEIEMQQVTAHRIRRRAFVRGIGHCAGVARVVEVIEDGGAVHCRNVYFAPFWRKYSTIFGSD